VLSEVSVHALFAGPLAEPVDWVAALDVVGNELASLVRALRDVRPQRLDL
jgi:hypothetical protein